MAPAADASPDSRAAFACSNASSIEKRSGGFVGDGGKLIDELANSLSGTAPMKPSTGRPWKTHRLPGSIELYLGSDLLSFIDVQFNELDFATGFGDDLFKDRC